MSRIELVKELHHLVSIFVRKRDKQCVICGTKEGLEAGHLFRRGLKNVTYDLKNVNCQCRTCNTMHEQSPDAYRNWYVKKFGQEDYENLERLSKVIKQWKGWELKEKIAEMKEKIKGLDNINGIN